MEGIDAILENAQGWKRAFPDARGRVLAAYADGPTVVVELEWEGTHTGPMTTPTGDELPPTQKRATVKACQVIEVDGGRIKSIRHYFNLMTLMNQLGVGVPSGTAAIH